MGRAHSTGDFSQQGLLPEVYRTACTRGCAHHNGQIPKNKEPRALCPGGLYSWWHFASPANGSGSHDCAPVMWACGIPCPAMVSPNAGPGKEDKLLHPDDHLIWCSKVDSGPRISIHFLMHFAKWKSFFLYVSPGDRYLLPLTNCPKF